jgi:DNA-binding NtrC family response regulator
MRGPELGRRIQKARPEIKIIYMTGYLDHHEDEGGILEEATILQKPFSRDSVVRHVSLALKGKMASKVETPTSTRMASEFADRP